MKLLEAERLFQPIWRENDIRSFYSRNSNRNDHRQRISFLERRGVEMAARL